MIENIFLEEIEFKGKNYNVEASAEYEIDDCACTSSCGDQEVTERWKEIRLVEVILKSVFYYDEKAEAIEVDLKNFSKDFLEIIKELSLEYISENL